MRKALTYSAILLGFAINALAQTKNPKLQFEVASVKASGPQSKIGIGGGPGTSQPDLLTIGRKSLRLLLMQAFGVNLTQIAGPQWLAQSADNFDIRAKVPAGATKNDASIMLRNLLVERFGLVYHRETRAQPGYELVVGKNGAKLAKSKDQDPPPQQPLTAASAPKFEKDRNGVDQSPAGRKGMLSLGSRRGDTRLISGRAVTVTELASELESMLGTPVVDRTGLTAKYDFSIAFDGTDLPNGFQAPASLTSAAAAGGKAPEVAAPSALPSVFTVVQQELGLRLDPEKVPVDFIVIDKLNKAPSGN